MKCSRLAVLLAVVLLALSGCRSGESAAAVAVLVDVTGSTEDNHYLQDLDKILNGLQGGERLLVLPVTARSAVEPVTFTLDVPAYHTWSSNPITYRRQLKRVRQQAVERMTDLLRRARSSQPGSGIIDAIDQAEALLAAYPADRRVLVVLSDMIEQSALADFSALDGSAVDRTLQKVSQQQRLPKLAGTRVYVAGITDGAIRMPPERVLAIKRFWSQFFAAAGAKLVSYGPALLDFRDGA